jgi:hypothetical protein
MSSTPPPPPGYGAPQYGAAAPNHPQTVVALVLAIVSWFVCGLFLSIPAYIIAKKAERETLASNGAYSGEGMAKAARIIALINIIVSVIAIVLVVILIAGGVLLSDGSSTTIEGY